MKATIKDLAKLAGVSFKTVSRVINREPSVGEELQSKVCAAIEELHYHPNLSARQLRGTLLSLTAVPSAFVACSDEIAAGALFATRIKQVAVPQQLSITGFEDSPFSRPSWPKLTTTLQPNSEIATGAARILIESIRSARHGNEQPAQAKLELKPELLVRDSTCPVPV